MEKYLMYGVYFGLLFFAIYYAIMDNYSRATFDLVLAYGIRWRIREEYEE